MKALSLLELAISSLLAAILFPLPATPLASHENGSGGIANLTGFAPKAGSPSAFSWLKAFPHLIPSPWKGFVMQDPLNFSGPKGSLTKGVKVRPLVHSHESAPKRLTPPEVGPRLESKALPLEWLLSPRKCATLESRKLPLDEASPAVATERILARMIQQKAHEEDPWLETDRHIAWLTVKWAAEGVPEWSWYHRDPPFVAATGETLHCDPDEVWGHIVAERKYKLGWEYSKFYDENGNWITEEIGATGAAASDLRRESLSPVVKASDCPGTSPGKKPSGSVPLESKEKKA